MGVVRRCFSVIVAGIIPTSLFLYTEGRLSARLLGLTDTREITALASAVAGG